MSSSLERLTNKLSSMPAPYGYCPLCGEPGIAREKRIGGNDVCRRGHTYPSKRVKSKSGLVGSPLYFRVLPKFDNLTKSIWDKTPWMVDAFTGSGWSVRHQAMIDWCEEQFGNPASPIHKIEGKWQRGCATIMGYTWMGFETEEMMLKFEEKWKVKKVTVCSSCLRASCWQGEFRCDDYLNAGTVQKSVEELKELNLEDSSYWEETR